MPDIEIVKLKVRRGTDSQRQSVVLEQGELGYTTDYKRVWIGDGFTTGGSVVGNIVHPPLYINSRTSLDTATTGDLVYEDNFLYQLSGTDYSKLSSWGFIGSVGDTTSIDYNSSNKLYIVDNAISARNLDDDVVYSSGAISLNSTEGLSANVDGATIAIDSTTNALSVRSIGADQISSSALGDGLDGGSGTTITVSVTDSFIFDSGQLSLSSVPAGTIDANALSGASVGSTLSVSSNVLNLATIGGGLTRSLDAITYDSYGRVTATSTTINQNLSGNASPYKGYLGQFPDNPSNGNTFVLAQSANPDDDTITAAVTLSSAGFLQFDTGTEGVVAIPVFKLPY